jgi:hypothetical protein
MEPVRLGFPYGAAAAEPRPRKFEKSWLGKKSGRRASPNALDNRASVI